MHRCEYCNHDFAKKSNLNNHQKTARYCLALRGQQPQIRCENCNRTFAEERTLIAHQPLCPNSGATLLDALRDKDIVIALRDREIVELKKDNAVLSERIKSQDEMISRLTLMTERYQGDMKEVAMKKSSVTNNNINILPLTNEWLTEQAQYLTQQHIEAGASGFAQLAKTHSFRNRVVCTDIARKSLRYNNKAGKMIRDPNGTELAERFFASIQSRNREIVQSIRDEIEDALQNTPPEDKIELYDKMSKLMSIDAEVSLSAKGTITELRNEFVIELCKILPKQ